LLLKPFRNLQENCNHGKQKRERGKKYRVIKIKNIICVVIMQENQFSILISLHLTRLVINNNYSPKHYYCGVGTKQFTINAERYKITKRYSEYIYIYKYIYIYTHIYIHIYMCVCVCVCVFCTAVQLLTLRWLMSCIYGAPILDVSRSHTTTQHSR